MSTAKMYTQQDIAQKVPQRIISMFLHTEIDKEEPVLAVFGSITLGGISNSVLSTDDRLVYMDKSSLVGKTTIILYVDIENVELLKKGREEYVSLLMAEGQNVTIAIKSVSEEVKKLYNFIQKYRKENMKSLLKRLHEDEEYADKIDALRRGENLKVYMIQKRGENDKEAIRQKYAAKRSVVIKEGTQEHIQVYEDYRKKIIAFANLKTWYSYKFDTCRWGRTTVNPRRIILDRTKQLLTVEIDDTSENSIPLAAISDSHITTDTEVPANDIKREYLFHLYITYTQDDANKELILSNMQQQYCAPDPIWELNYALQAMLGKMDV